MVVEATMAKRKWNRNVKKEEGGKKKISTMLKKTTMLIFNYDSWFFSADSYPSLIQNSPPYCSKQNKKDVKFWGR